jgi:signal peptidase I
VARRSQPWRDNLEAVTMAVIMAVLFKYFVVEAYKIPTGSMQPTLFGWEDSEGGGIFDRILVDKASYHWRDPERFEVVVFKFPLDRSKNFVKRIWGLPGDRIRIRHGDVWMRRSDTEPWRVRRRPAGVQGSTWRELESAGRWSYDEPSWREEGEDLLTTGGGAASFPKGTSSVRNGYTDGYPAKLGARVEEQRRLPGGDRNVGDLRIELSIEAEGDTEQVRLVLREGLRRYTAIIPGPAAAKDARPRLLVSDPSHRIQPIDLVSDHALRLTAGRPLRVAFENLDDRVRFELPGFPALEIDVPEARDQRAGVLLEARGGGAAFRDIELWRDTYYTSSGSIRDEFEVPTGHYFMLGDNTLDSADSREWQFAGFRVETPEYAGARLRGSRRRDENPIDVLDEEGEFTTFFHDEFGERHVFPRRLAYPLTPEAASFVPRELITGRALLVFWPVVPKLDVYRPHWIR